MNFKIGDLVNATFSLYEFDFGHKRIWAPPAIGFDSECDSELIQIKVNKVQHAIFMGVDVNPMWYYININGINVAVYNKRVIISALEETSINV